MDIRQLHYFLTLCEEMNYTRAAQRLFLSCLLYTSDAADD